MVSEPARPEHTTYLFVGSVRGVKGTGLAMILQTEEKIRPAMVQSWLILMVEIKSLINDKPSKLLI